MASELVHSVLQETKGDKDAALLVLADRLIRMAQGTSSGFVRAKPPAPVELNIRGARPIE